MAMMVITAGIVMLMVGGAVLQSSGGPEADEADLRQFAAEISGLVLGDEEMAPQEGVLLNSSLYLLNSTVLPDNDAALGYRITLIVLGDAPVVRDLAWHGSLPEGIRLSCSVRTPVNLVVSVSEVRAALLEVMAWC